MRPRIDAHSASRPTPRLFAIPLLALAACVGHAEPAPPPPFLTRSVEAPIGAAQAGVLRCGPGASGCAAVVPGDPVAWGAELKTARGARASFALGEAVLELADEAAVSLAYEGDTRVVQIDRGTVVLELPASPGASTLSLRVVDRVLVPDGAMPLKVAIRASAADRATVTVLRGGVAIQASAGAPARLAAGESAQIALGQPVDPRAGLAAAPVLPASHADGPRPLDAAAESAAPPPRGFGAMTARVPGQPEIVPGVRLVSHKVDVEVRDGFARTQIEEEFLNETPRVLEGRYAFPMPPSASLSRLALWVGATLVEGEIVERDTAARIFKGIVEDTVRPRDPALLEWVSGGELALKVFPIPPRGKRKVVLAYDQALASAGGRVRYVYPLSLGADRAVTIDDFAISFNATDSVARLADVETPRYPATLSTDDHGFHVAWSARAFTPAADFTVAFERTPVAPAGARAPGEAPPAAAQVSAHLPKRGELGADPARKPGEPGNDEGAFAAVRFNAELPEDAVLPESSRRDRAIVVDTSASQSPESIAGEAKVALGLLLALEPEERFVLLACDSACVTYPEDGLATTGALDEARRFLAAQTPRGSSDVAGALSAAARRLDGGAAGQVIYLGDGAASAGELATAAIAARVAPALANGRLELCLLGAGGSVDDVALNGLARALGGTYERVATGEELGRRIESLAIGLRRPVITGARLELPSSLTDVYPRVLPNLRVGDEVVVVGRLARAEGGTITLRGDLAGKPYARAMTMSFTSELASNNPLVPRLWAGARIEEIEAEGTPASARDVVALSKHFHVMSRATSLLVLENDRMFAEFGIARTKSAGQSTDALFDVPRPTPPAFGRIGLLEGHAGRNDSFGSAGLGLSGVGAGGGGRDESAGPPPTIAVPFMFSKQAEADRPRAAPGTEMPQSLPPPAAVHRAKAPQLRMASASVSGRLPPEAIQRIVRQNHGRLRACYEEGLKANPNLAGRVAVRFVIGSTGAVTNAGDGGSDIGDPGVVRCVIQSFRGLSFPAPDTGIITVVYPINFSSDGTRPPGPRASEPPAPPEPPRAAAPRDWFPTGPNASHRAGDAAWMSAGEAAIESLRRAAAAAPASRGKREALIRGLLSRGRFAAALVEAQRFAALDPDSAAARELVAEAEAASGHAAEAVLEIDALVETSPTDASAHARAARAFEAAGDERRACAHWRSLAELRGADEGRSEAARCRARVFGERAAATAEARAVAKPGPRVAKLLALLESTAAVPAYEAAGSAGSFEATVSCAAGVERCPTVVVVTPGGKIVSPWTPTGVRSTASAVSLASLVDGTYRTVVVGGADDAHGEVVVRALGAVKRFELTRGGLQTIAATTVSNIL